MAGTSTTQRLTERVAAPFHGVTVDREAGVIRNVLLCGVESANRRRYPWGSTLKHRKGLYERKGGYWGHGQSDQPLCWYENERTDDQGRPRADLHVFKSHPKAEQVFEAAERRAPNVGLSHVATCKTRSESGWVVVEDVVEVERVDVVADPATTHGFHESTHQPGATVTTIRKLLETLAPRLDVSGLLRLRRLTEMDGMGDLPVEPPPADAAPKDGVTAAFKAAIMSVVDGALGGSEDPKAALQKIKKLIASHGDVNGDGKVDDADVEAAEEAKKKAPPAADGTQLVEALGVCDRIGFRPDRTDLETVAAASADRREAVARRLKESAEKTAGGTGGPRTTPRCGGAGPQTTTTTATESRQGGGRTPAVPDSVWLT